MRTLQTPEDFPEAQSAIYRVALSLDAFLLNGIPFGVIQGSFFNGFVEKTAGNLIQVLGELENQVAQAPAASHSLATEALGDLRARCQQLIDLVTGLISFRTLPFDQLRSTVSQIPLLRGECVRLIQELEVALHTPKPFYPSRPKHSTDAVNGFLNNLEEAFTREWTHANPALQGSGAT